MTNKLTNFGRRLRNVALAGAVAAVAVGTVAAPAMAFPQHGYGYRHDRGDWHRHWAPTAYGYGYGYAPGSGYAPAYVPGPFISLPGLDFFLPIHIR